MAYTAAEQAEISRRYPGMQWVNGMPYTSAQDEQESDPYLGANAAPSESGGESLRPAHTTSQNFPWEFFLAQVAAPALVAGGSAAGSAAFGGGGAGGAAGGAGATGTFGGLPVGTLASAPTTGMVGLGGGAAAGGGGAMSTLGKLGSYGQTASKLFGNMAGQSADAQMSNALLKNQQYGTQQNAEMNAGALDLNRKRFDEDSEASRMKRALIGQLLGNMQDVNVSVPGITPANISGGLRPSALGDLGRSLSGEMSTRAADQARAGNTYQGGNVLTPPNTPTGGNKALNTLAVASSLLGAFGK